MTRLEGEAADGDSMNARCAVRARIRREAALVVLLAGSPALAQNSLEHSIPAPPVGLQTGAAFGASVATDGPYIVVGAPNDDLGAQDSGAVRVFDSTSGALLLVIPNPSPAETDQFGWSVAISGSRLVVGALGDDTGIIDAGTAYVYDLNGVAPTVPVAILNNPGPGLADRFGWSVAISGTRVVVGTGWDDTDALNSGSAYVYDLGSSTPTSPVVTLNNPTPAALDSFGFSVAISGTRVVVGAHGDGTGAPCAGSAYVFDMSGGAPAFPVLTLNNPAPATCDSFGRSVAISGTRVLVGAYFDDSGSTDAGSAYVYDLGSATPTVPVTTINNPSPAASDHFGAFVAISGTRLIVTAPADDAGATGAGTAYAYDLSSATPTAPVATLHNPAPDPNDSFGTSAAISGTRVLVGAVSDDTAAVDAGSVYVFELSGGDPTLPVATLNDPGPVTNDRFGTSVAISGIRAVVGVPLDDTGAIDAGSAYVYELSGATPTLPVATLNNPDPGANDQFGQAVAISGPLVVVGAFLNDAGAVDAGSAYVFDISSGTPMVPVAILNNPAPDAGDEFGRSVAISGTRVIVGAHRDDTGASDAGSSYVYDLSSGTPTVPIATLNNPGPASNDHFGFSVAISGMRVVVGAYMDDSGATDAGRAYVYDLSSGSPTTPVLMLNNPSPASNDQFGYNVAVSGMRVVVGTPQNDVGGTDSGTAYVYEIAGGAPMVPVVTLDNPGPATGDGFGSAVGISGTRVVVGAGGNDTAATNAGGAYVYEFDSDTPTMPVATLANPGPAVGDGFGYSVSIDGTTALIGAPLDDSVVADKGFAYVFTGTPEIDLTGNGMPITDDDTTPDTADDTDFGSVSLPGSPLVRAYTIANRGTVDLLLGAVTFSGTHAADFSVSLQPAPSLAPGGSTHLEVSFDPSGVGLRSATLSLSNNDSNEHPFNFSIQGTVLPVITVSDVTLIEGNSGVSNAVFTLTSSAPSSETVTVSALTSNLSATAGSDYTAAGPTTVTFAPTVTTQTFSVPVIGDTDLESDETFLVTLSSPVNATIVDDTALGAITNDDGEPPSRVFVSSSGNDTNVCMTQTTPCRNLSAAIGQLAIDGEVIVLTSGEYDNAPILIGKGVKITSPSGTVAFIRQPVTVNAPGGRVALRGLTLKGNAASNGITLTAADSLSIEDTAVDGWGVGLDIANAAPSTVAITKTVFQGNQTAVGDLGPASNRVAIGGSRFVGNGTGLLASAGTFAVRESSFVANLTAISVSSGLMEIHRSELWSNGTGLAVLSGGTARIGRSHVFGNTTGISAAGGSTLASFGTNVTRGNGTNVDGTVTTVPEQ